MGLDSEPAIPSAPSRCDWGAISPLMAEYHDQEWGVPVHDDRKLFEFLILDGAQAGLSWSTILNKREGYRRAFRDFDPAAVAAMGPDDVAELLQMPLIIRNRMKIESAIKNARAFLAAVEEFGSFDSHFWSFVGGRTIQNTWRTMAEIPAKSEESEAMSADLRKRGFTFVGPTICYAVMQSAGLVNDHIVGCFRHAELRGDFGS